MRSILITAVVLSASAVPVLTSSSKVDKMQAMAACKYEILKLGHDEFSGSRLADMCMTSKGYQYDAAMPECSGQIGSMFNYDCFTTLERWEQVTQEINDCTVGLAERMNVTGGEEWKAASEACLDDLGYVQTGFGMRPAGYGLD